MASDAAVYSPNRSAVRAFVQGRAQELELAQADNRLPQLKLDLRDAFEATLPDCETAVQEKALRMFDEELDALCQQLRIGGVVVATQVERVKAKKEKSWGLLSLAWCVSIVLATTFAAMTHTGIDVFLLVGAVLFWGSWKLVMRER